VPMPIAYSLYRGRARLRLDHVNHAGNSTLPSASIRECPAVQGRRLATIRAKRRPVPDDYSVQINPQLSGHASVLDLIQSAGTLVFMDLLAFPFRLDHRTKLVA
jgi:hypothetical protein